MQADGVYVKLDENYVQYNAESTSANIEMDGVGAKVTQRDVLGGQELTSEMKFD